MPINIDDQFTSVVKQPIQIIYLIYSYKKDLALNNLQRLICLKTQPNQIIYI